MSIPDFRKILEVKRYSQNTIDAYISVIQMARQFFNHDLSKVSEKDLHQYFYHLVHTKGISYSYQKQIVMGLKLYYDEVFGRKIYLEFLMPSRKPERLPTILAKSEILRIIDQANNLKHKSMIALVYSAGLRVGEMINLKIVDIDSSRMVIHLRAAKGNKDRFLPLSEKLLTYLRDYYKEYHPKVYLFEGQKGNCYSPSSFNKLLQASAKRAKIKKKITAHTLRHSYATHLLENGTDIRVIQKMLGHSSLKTTMIYTQVAQATMLKVKSPFDD